MQVNLSHLRLCWWICSIGSIYLFQWLLLCSHLYSSLSLSKTMSLLFLLEIIQTTAISNFHLNLDCERGTKYYVYKLTPFYLYIYSFPKRKDVAKKGQHTNPQHIDPNTFLVICPHNWTWVQGIHRWSYQLFTNQGHVSKRINSLPDDDDNQHSTTKYRILKCYPLLCFQSIVSFLWQK